MITIPRLALGLILGLTLSVGSLESMPAAAQIIIDDCGMTTQGMSPALAQPGVVACGEPGDGPPVAHLPQIPSTDGPQNICDFYGFCGAAEPGAP